MSDQIQTVWHGRGDDDSPVERGGSSEVIQSMAENKSRFTGASVEDYIAARGTEQQRADCQQLIALLTKVTRRPPQMWGPSIVGFGSYRYTYESGHSGEAPLTGFAIRGRELVIYLLPEQDEQKSLLSRLGPHKMGKSCLYFKRLADLDRSVLEKLVAVSVADVKRRYRQNLSETQ
jgi:hypothetical protein